MLLHRIHGWLQGKLIYAVAVPGKAAPLLERLPAAPVVAVGRVPVEADLVVETRDVVASPMAVLASIENVVGVPMPAEVGRALQAAHVLRLDQLLASRAGRA